MVAVSTLYRTIGTFVATPFTKVIPAVAAKLAADTVGCVVPFGATDPRDSKAYEQGYQFVAAPNVDIGILFIFAVSSLAVYGIILGGWASNSKYAVMGALRAASQVISYEIAMGFALVGVLVAAGSMNLTEIVNAQTGNSGFLEWFFIPLFPLFLVYFISGTAETNRAPFDVAEGESEEGNGHAARLPAAATRAERVQWPRSRSSSSP